MWLGGAGQPREVEAGSELYISYNVLEHGMSPLNVSRRCPRSHSRNDQRCF